MADLILGLFSVYPSGNIGQEIRDADGKIIAWTTDAWVAQVIARLLSENDHLLTTGNLKCKAVPDGPAGPVVLSNEMRNC